jgi:hypothetical protein
MARSLTTAATSAFLIVAAIIFYPNAATVAVLGSVVMALIGFCATIITGYTGFGVWDDKNARRDGL